ncbi:MAG: hypothetical protein ABSF70_04720 [Terracidiphilus sp.]|jgi:hypothetical protein
MNNNQSRGPFLFPDPCSLKKAYPPHPPYKYLFLGQIFADNYKINKISVFRRQFPKIHIDHPSAELQIIISRIGIRLRPQKIDRHLHESKAKNLPQPLD